MLKLYTKNFLKKLFQKMILKMEFDYKNTLDEDLENLKRIKMLL